VLRFGFDDAANAVIASAYRPLLRSGHLETLSAFAKRLRVHGDFPPPSVDLVEAEVAMRDGNFPLATSVASRVREAMHASDPLACRASLVIGQCAFFTADFAASADAYRDARALALDDEDVLDALYGWTVSAIQGELDGRDEAFGELRERQNRSPLDLVRYATALLAYRRFQSLSNPPPVEDALHALPRVEDPRVRSALLYALSYDAGLRSDYERALVAATSCKEEVEAYDLDFAKPYNDWNLGFANLGLRRFAAAEAALQRVEDANQAAPVAFHVVNAHVLRIRLALTTGRIDEALSLSRHAAPETVGVLRSLAGEEAATRGLCFAIAGKPEEAVAAADEGERMTRAVEVRTLAATTRTVAEAEAGGTVDLSTLFDLAAANGTWDPLLLGLRASARLAEQAAGDDDIRPLLASLYARSRDFALARKAGLRQRSRRSPHEILSPRELEVLQLMSRGFRNRDIARALVISESTTKVHVRHVFEKLGVRTRTEAVARFEMFR
jgi:DNA-binding CsgD family transcriptional regulator